MKINKKIFSLFALVTFLSCIAPVTVFAEEYVLGKKYYKNFPGTGNKWVKLHSITEYDKNGNEIHYKSFSGYEQWYEYDANGNLTHRKDSYGNEAWHEYDKNGNLIHMKNSDGYEDWYEYDKNGNKIYWKNSYGDEAWYEYDKNGNLIHMKNSDGDEDWYEYSYWPDGTIKKAWEFIKF